MEDHSISLLRAACTMEVAHSTFGEEAQMASSSAKSKTLTDIGRKVRRSLINRKKSTGPRTEPWETPLQRRKGQL